MSSATAEYAHAPVTRSENGRLRVIPLRQAWNIPWVVLGVLLVAGSALGFTVLGRSDQRGTAALILGSPVDAGEAITEADLRVVHIDGAASGTVGPERRTELIGRLALVDLAAGSVLSDGVVASSPVLEDGRALVAISIDPSTAPIAGLRQGDAVMAVRTPGPTDVADGTAPTVWAASVFAVTSVATPSGDVVSVSLNVDTLDAPAVASAAASDQVRLVLVRSVDGIPDQLLFPDAPPAPTDDAGTQS